MYDYDSRLIAEAVYQETLDLMTPAERDELARRQDEARKEDYWDSAWEAMRGEVE